MTYYTNTQETQLAEIESKQSIPTQDWKTIEARLKEKVSMYELSLHSSNFLCHRYLGKLFGHLSFDPGYNVHDMHENSVLLVRIIRLAHSCLLIIQ